MSHEENTISPRITHNEIIHKIGYYIQSQCHSVPTTLIIWISPSIYMYPLGIACKEQFVRINIIKSLNNTVTQEMAFLILGVNKLIVVLEK